MKNFVKTICFICVLLICVFFAQEKLGYADQLGTQNVLKDYYQLEENCTDVICLGTSAVQRGWLVPIVYDKLGISSYTLATASQPFCLTKFIMKEACKTQKPKVFVVDIRSAIETPKEADESFIRRVTDNLRESKLRIEAVKYALDFAEKGSKLDTKDISYYFKLAKYHELYNPEKRPENAGVKYYNGFAYYEPTYYKVVPQEDVGIVKKNIALDKNTEKVLNDLLNYCDSIEAETVFTLIPFNGTEDELAKINSAIKLVRNRGYECINFLEEDNRAAIGVDFDKFYYNERHTNYYGSEKYSMYMGQYLKEKFNLPDRRDDPKCKNLAKNSKAFIKETQKQVEELNKKISQ